MNTTKINTPLEYGFFNCADGAEDRVYTAENFTGYLSAIICDGILDTWGDCFSMTYSDTSLTIGSGYAWIGGHYAILPQSQTVDLTAYADMGLSRMIAVGISCDTSSGVRACSFEIASGLAGSSDKPAFANTDTKKYLTLCHVKLAAGGEITDIADCRGNESLCGYVKCILGKCRVTELLEKMDEVIGTVSDLKEKVADLTERVNSITGEILATGKCGDNAFYVQYSDGTLNVKGSGALYDYENGASPFYGSEYLSHAEITDGITSIGAYAFRCCPALTSVSLPSSILSIGDYAFAGSVGASDPQSVLSIVTIPGAVTSIGKYAFFRALFTEITIPSSVTTVGSYAFSQCGKLERATVRSSVMGVRMFNSAAVLSNLTISANVKTISEGALQYCPNLSQINYEGTIDQWNAIDRSESWDGYDDDVASNKTHITRIVCTDGVLIGDDTAGWIEEET